MSEDAIKVEKPILKSYKQEANKLNKSSNEALPVGAKSSFKRYHRPLFVAAKKVCEAAVKIPFLEGSAAILPENKNRTLLG